MKALLSIAVDEKAVKAVRKSIRQILDSGQDQDTMKVALQVLQTACRIDNVRVEGCTFTKK